MSQGEGPHLLPPAHLRRDHSGWKRGCGSCGASAKADAPSLRVADCQSPTGRAGAERDSHMGPCLPSSIRPWLGSQARAMHGGGRDRMYAVG